MPTSDEILRKLLTIWSHFDPGFRIEGNQLVVSDETKSLQMLERTYMDLLAQGACKVDERIQEKITHNQLEEEAFQLVLANELAMLAQIWDKESITAILLKGFSLRPYYPDKCIRPSSDLDFLVHPKDKCRCLSALKTHRYEPVPDESKIKDRIQHHGELGWKNPHTKMKIECHWDIISSPSMRSPIDYDPDFVFHYTQAMDIDLVPRPVSVLTTTMNLAYLMCHHVLQHQYRGLIWLADVLLLAGSGEVDWTEFERIVCRLKVEKPVHYYLHAIQNLFGNELVPDINRMKLRLAPKSFSYQLFRRSCSPTSIFKHPPFLGKLRAKVFRNAFK